MSKLKERMDKLGLVAMEDIEGVKYNQKIKVVDREGYLYSVSNSRITSCIKDGGVLAKYFLNNPYTYENINTYLKNNNIKLRLVTTNPTSATIKIDFKCTIDENIINRNWNGVKNGNVACNVCKGAFDYTYENVCEYVKSEGATFISEKYNGLNKNHQFRCECGREFTRLFSVFKGTENREGCHKCKHCTGATIKYTYDEVKKDLLSHGIELLQNTYKNNREPMEIRYKCGFEYKKPYGEMKIGNYECPHCKRIGFARDTNQLRKEVDGDTNGEYTLMSEFEKMNAYVLIKHNTCGHQWNITPHHFVDGGRRCPMCASSKAEILINKILNDNYIEFEEQMEFDGLIGIKGGNLRFDFAILDNSKLKLLIEYDGEYHFSPIVSQAQLEKQQEHDRRKDVYCKENNIELVRIPYWEFDNLENIICEIIH